jgi:hypothetical protein
MRRGGDGHVNMVQLQIPFQNLAFFLLSQDVEHGSLRAPFGFKLLTCPRQSPGLPFSY